jgi:hypothetical protein
MDKGLIKAHNIRKTANSARSASELEDLYPLSVLCASLRKLGIDADDEFRNGKAQFSVRTRSSANKQGVVLANDAMLKLKLDLDAMTFDRKRPEDPEAIKSLDSICQKVLEFLQRG